MEELELIRLEEANRLLLKASVFLSGKDRRDVDSIIYSNKTIIDSYNKNELTVINPTKTELGTISSSLKKIVLGCYNEYLNKIKFNGEYSHSERYTNCDCYELSNNLCVDCNKEDVEIDDFYDKAYELNKPYRDLHSQVVQLCNKTVIPKDLISAKILLMRQTPNYYSYNKLQCETNEFIKIKMLEAFNEQNEDFIKTKILTLK